MILCNRITTRGGRAVLNPPRRFKQPLLFLYPVWIRSASSTAVEENEEYAPTSTTTNEGKRAQTKSTTPPISLYSFQNSADNLSDADRNAARQIELRAAKAAFNWRRRSQIQAQIYDERPTGTADWRTVLKRLDFLTPKRSARWHDNALRIKMSKEAMDDFLFGEDNTIWELRSLTGCHIEQVELLEDDEDFRCLMLSGSVSSVAKAAAKIMYIAPTAQQQEGSVFSEHNSFRTNSEPGSAGHGTELVFRRVRGHRREYMQKANKVENVPRPTQWTKQEFAQYIQHLTYMKVSSQLSSHLYGSNSKSTPHHDRVLKILEEVFFDPTNRYILSVAAVNDALAYYVKHNQILAARSLFDHMETCGIGLNVDTFNILLRGTAKSRDLTSFDNVLNVMARRGFTPNEKTWIAFMRCVPDLKIKRIILKSILEKELIQDWGARKEVAGEFVESEIIHSLDTGVPLSDFLASMDMKYGKDWLSSHNGNAVVKALVSRDRIAQCCDFIGVMVDRRIKPDSSAINIILTYCRDQLDSQVTINTLNDISRVPPIPFDSISYEILFQIAWKHKFINLAIVVWRYACLDCTVTHRMRKRVTDSIVKLIKARPLASGNYPFDVTAGSLCLGSLTKPGHVFPSSRSIVPGREESREAGTGMELHTQPSSIELFSSHQTSKRDRTTAMKLAMEANTTMFTIWQPFQPLINMLLAAMEKDLAATLELKDKAHDNDGTAAEIPMDLKSVENAADVVGARERSSAGIANIIAENDLTTVAIQPKGNTSYKGHRPVFYNWT